MAVPMTDPADRIINLEFELEPMFLAMMEHAVSKGWTATEAAVAITSLADNHMLALEANGMTETQIDFIKRGET